MTFEEANRLVGQYEDQKGYMAFGLEISGAICERCLLNKKCKVNDCDDYNEIISKCNFYVEQEDIDCVKTDLSILKEQECDGWLWDEEPDVDDFKRHSEWSVETWDKFDNLPAPVEVVNKHKFLKDKITKGSKVIDIYDYLQELGGD